jgi:hypothetical protein
METAKFVRASYPFNRLELDGQDLEKKMRHLIVRIINRLARPFGMRCVLDEAFSPALELPGRHLINSRIVSERSDILKLLPKGGTVAEVGVAFGRYSRKIIDIMKPKRFVAIDTFQLDAPSLSGHSAYSDVFGELTHEKFYEKEFSAEIQTGRLLVKKGYSSEMLAEFPSGFFDMIYIDAAHDYDSVKKDLELASEKISDGGFLILNDYTILDPLLLQPYGIVQATNEFCISKGWEVVYLALHPYMFCDIALSKIKT